MMAEELVNIDFEISVTSKSSDAAITADVSGHTVISYEEESNDEKQLAGSIWKPAFKGVMNAITVLEEYSLFWNFGADLMKALIDINCAFDLDCLSNKKQYIIKDLFRTL